MTRRESIRIASVISNRRDIAIRSRLGSTQKCHATDALTIGLAKELAPHGVRVNAVRPGLIETDIHASAGAPDRVERLMGGVPMGRAGSAEEVAQALLWLLGDRASYVNGTFVDVSGGR